MMGFLFAVLGSTLFWVVYGIVTIFGSTITMKAIAPGTMKILLGESKMSGYRFLGGWLGWFMIFITHILLWPIILMVIVIIEIIKFAFSSLVINVFKFVNSKIPTIRFNKD